MIKPRVDRDQVIADVYNLLKISEKKDPRIGRMKLSAIFGFKRETLISMVGVDPYVYEKKNAEAMLVASLVSIVTAFLDNYGRKQEALLDAKIERTQAMGTKERLFAGIKAGTLVDRTEMRNEIISIMRDFTGSIRGAVTHVTNRFTQGVIRSDQLREDMIAALSDAVDSVLKKAENKP